MTKGGSLILIVIIIFTFPIWIGLAGGLIGLIGGLIGGLFGLIGGLIGAVFGIIGGVFGAIFDLLFGWGHWEDGYGWHPHSHWNAGQWILIIVIVALLVRRRRSRS
jgi:hypothetical protein